MNKIMKLLKAITAAGFATPAQKAEVAELFKVLAVEEQETLAEDVKVVAAMTEVDPKSASAEDELEKNIKTLISRAVDAKTPEAVQKEIEKVKDSLKEYVESQLAEIKAAAGTQHPDVKVKRAGINAYMREYTKAVLKGNEAELMKLNNVTSTKELTTDATGSPFGGYAVDRELSMEILAITTEYGVARREFNTIQLSKGSYLANELVSDVTVFWVDEAAQIPSTQIVLGREALTLKKLGAIVTLTRELLEDSEIDLFGFIGTRIAQGFALFEDRAFFMGEGAGDTANAEYTGIVFAAANEVFIPVRGSLNGESFAHLTADDALALQDALPQSLVSSGKYYGHRSIRNLIRVLKDANGTPIYQSPVESGPATLWGRPYVEVEVMPSTGDSAVDTGFLLYGDLKKSSLFGYKGTISADRFNAGTVRNVANNADINLITTDREAIRWIERVGAIHPLPQAVAVLKTAGGS